MTIHVIEHKGTYLKKIIIVFVIGLLVQQITRAQGTIYLSNLGPGLGFGGVGSNSWQATSFTAGNNVDGYLLNSIQLAMTDASGNPSGFSVMIYGTSWRSWWYFSRKQPRHFERSYRSVNGWHLYLHPCFKSHVITKH